MSRFVQWCLFVALVAGAMGFVVLTGSAGLVLKLVSLASLVAAIVAVASPRYTPDAWRPDNR